jgi:phosphoribosyl 1,2-cyclic phosphate phosphodiesterase
VNLEIRHSDIQGQLVILGTGTSVGVPAVGCPCRVCRSDNPKNQRLRCAAIAGLPQGNLLIDTPPDLRTQLLREQIGVVHAVAYTHEHADHVMGLDDLRLMQFYLGHPVPIYCTSQVEARIRRSFDYAFTDEEETHVGATPRLEFRRIEQAPFRVLGATVIPLRLRHGPRLEVLGFRIANVAYCTDTNYIPPETFPQLEGLDVLILDALRHRPHATHFALAEAIQVAQRVGARHTYFTHICHNLEHEATNAALPPSMQLAYDGQRISLSEFPIC